MHLRGLLILAFLITLFFGIFLGSRPLSVPDEGRYTEIPREMVMTHNWLTPRLNGIKYFEKPPLFYWFEAVLIALFGIVFPAMIIFSWMLVTNEWRVLRSMSLWSGIAISLCIAAPWHILVNRANPGFFDFYFIREHFQRSLTKVHHHYKPLALPSDA